MTLKRRILKIVLLSVLAAAVGSSATSEGSATKVGNGDDGTDLESLTPIRSGPIFAAREKAIKTLENLNVPGIPGLGLLVPELQRTDILIAAKDVHPTGEQDGSFEVSDDKRIVYARTFAQPYAATRFFPSAQKLTAEQLVALHIHEALHRALPSDIRTDEDVVMHLTLAMTSPGANFDRVRQVASLYIKEAGMVARHVRPMTTLAEFEEEIALPAKSRTTLGYEFDSYDKTDYGISEGAQFHGLAYTTSLFGFKKIFGQPMEPTLKIRLKYPVTQGSEKLPGSFIGPTSYELKGRFLVGERTFMGPVLRFSAKSLDESVRVFNDRDVFTVGAFYSTEADRSYFDSGISFSTPSTTSNKVHYKSIFSLGAHSGYKWGHARLGLAAELHASETPDIGDATEYYIDDATKYYNELEELSTVRPGSFRILTAGPEFTYATDSFEFNLSGQWIFNNSAASLDVLGDPMDHGSGRGGMHSSIKMIF